MTRKPTGVFELDMLQLMESYQLRGVPGRVAATVRDAARRRDLETLQEWLPRMTTLMLNAPAARRKPQP